MAEVTQDSAVDETDDTESDEGTEVGDEGDTPVPTGNETVDAKGEDEAEKPETDTTTDVEAKPEEKPATLEEAKAKVAAANRTMAAARRAEARIEAVKKENDALKADLGEHKAFVSELLSSPKAALRRIKYQGSVTDFLKELAGAHINDGEDKAPSIEDKVAAWEAERETERKAARQAEADREVKAARTRINEAIAKDERFDLAATEPGQDMLWEAIVEYNRIHKDVPDEVVFQLAEAVENELTEKFSKSKKFALTVPGAKNAQLRDDKPIVASKPGTIKNNMGSTPKPKREYSMDPDKRREEVLEDLFGREAN